MTDRMYYDVAYSYDFFTLTVPFLAAAAIFYLTYLAMFRRSHHRIRAKRLVAK